VNLAERPTPFQEYGHQNLGESIFGERHACTGTRSQGIGVYGGAAVLGNAGIADNADIAGNGETMRERRRLRA
jgi:hypothetical protein